MLFLCASIFLRVVGRQLNISQQIQDVLSLAKQRGQLPSKKKPTQSTDIRICGPEDADEMSRVFRSVFKTYPFPIFDAEYLFAVMKNKQTRYFCMENDRQINAIAASEIDSDNKGVEMTDFAT
ncbi:MAG: hypothetical protein JRI64_09335, partial [Deltaproteobacteria bacterium]|nr:hypothetical protein [Deltaproteobacteria bacterium]